tara:strand:+ start:24 stop:542 length:519 start_codon:yes stop_codon:yes gene_type:complete
MSTKEYGTNKKSETNFSYLSIGSNIEDRLQNLLKSQIEIEEYIGKIHKSSKIYETEPWGYKEQKFFLNQVLYVQTLLEAESLLKACKKIERNMGRVNNKKWGERNIDIDILYYNNDSINKKNLQIPHKHLHERKFILKPLNDINPNYINPKLLKTTSKLLNECTDKSIVNDI